MRRRARAGPLAYGSGASGARRSRNQPTIPSYTTFRDLTPADFCRGVLLRLDARYEPFNTPDYIFSGVWANVEIPLARTDARLSPAPSRRTTSRAPSTATGASRASRRSGADREGARGEATS